MTIRDIIICVEPDASQEAGPVEAYAVSLAGGLGARLTVLAPSFSHLLGTVPRIPPLHQIREDIVRASDDAAREALAAVAGRANSAKVGVEQEIVPADHAAFADHFSLAAFADHFSLRARICDLAVLLQPQDASPWRRVLTEAVLFDSGRPVVIVPYIHKGAARFDRILVAWDGSKEAARAVHDALPLLQSAKNVEVLTVQVEGHKPGRGADPEALAAHLVRHGLPATGRSHVVTNIGITDAMLSHAADSGSDLIVMGGYAHSRLRHLVFGGATSGILETMTVPVLMAH